MPSTALRRRVRPTSTTATSRLRLRHWNRPGPSVRRPLAEVMSSRRRRTEHLTVQGESAVVQHHGLVIAPVARPASEGCPVQQENVVLTEFRALSAATKPRTIGDARIQRIGEQREIAEPVNVFTSTDFGSETINEPVRLPLLRHDVFDWITDASYSTTPPSARDHHALSTTLTHQQLALAKRQQP